MAIGEAPPLSVPLRTAARLLPPGEWPRLAGLPFASQGLPDPSSAIVFVAEDPTGAIVGLWAIFLQPVLDGLWVDPAHRLTPVASQLLTTVRAFLQTEGVQYAFTVIADPGVMVLAHKAGFVRAPGDLWMLPVPADPPPERAS